MLNTTLITSMFLAMVAMPLRGQDAEHSHEYDHHHRHHEFAIGTGVVFMPEESAWGYGLHLHAIAGIKEWMGAGFGYEYIGGEHTHHTLTGLVHFHPFHPLHINMGPGLVLPDEENRSVRFKIHAEIAAVFEISEHLHLGPSLDTGIGKNDLHFSLGIHAGWAFGFKE
ncbi:MAG: hypothetical protein V2B15_03965 [Bacteroidota bacterium]